MLDTDVSTSCSGPYVEDKNTPEDPLDSLGDVPPWALGLGSGTKERRIKSLAMRYFPRDSPKSVHSDELYSLEAEGSLNDDGQDSQEPIGARIIDQSGTSDGTRILPVLESSSRSTRAAAQGNDEASDDEPNN